MNIITM